VTLEERLAALVDRLGRAGVNVLVMGGHAVRHYGVGRNTTDFDFVVEPMPLDELRRRVVDGGVGVVREGPSWRPDDFARFEIGRLPDGREEWLEFWLHNHLLPAFDELHARQERSAEGGTTVGYISLEDLLRSNETVRESDWQDIALLEEIRDARGLANASTRDGVIGFLSTLRSRAGFDKARSRALLEDRGVVEAAAARCRHAVTLAYLLPSVPEMDAPPGISIDPDRLTSLRTVRSGDTKHIGLVEIVRRAYKRRAMDADRADKQSRLGRR
jgi:hypothetical protein